jgi:hypothetical protein
MHGMIFRKKVIGNEVHILILSEKFVSEAFLILQGIQ